MRGDEGSPRVQTQLPEPRTRLDTFSPQLAEAFRASTSEHRKKAALRACEIAVEQTGLGSPEVEQALAALREGREDVAEGVHARILEIGGEFDDRYLMLAEAGASEAEVLGAFSRARATFAVALALQGGSETLHEAIYEAGMSCSNAVDFVSEVREILFAR